MLGLAGAPAAYQLHMEDVQQGIHGDGVMIYIDDFLYYSETVEQHLDIMARVFERLLNMESIYTPRNAYGG